MLWLAKLGLGLAGKLYQAYEGRQQAKSRAEEYYWNDRIKILEAKRDVQIAEAGQWGGITKAVVREIIGGAVAFYYAKIFVYDKALGLGSTDALSEHLTWVAGLALCFYFVDHKWGRKRGS